MHISFLSWFIIIYIVSCAIGHKVLDYVIKRRAELPGNIGENFYTYRKPILLVYHIPVLNTLMILLWAVQLLFLKRLKFYQKMRRMQQEEDDERRQ